MKDRFLELTDRLIGIFQHYAMKILLILMKVVAQNK